MRTKIESSPPEIDPTIKIETGNATLDSLFNSDLADPEKYDQEIVQIIKKHLAMKDIPSNAGTQLGEELIHLAESGDAE